MNSFYLEKKVGNTDFLMGFLRVIDSLCINKFKVRYKLRCHVTFAYHVCIKASTLSIVVLFQNFHFNCDNALLKLY